MKRHIAIFFLMFACFMGLTTMVVPHHHHHDGRVCLLLGDNTAGEPAHTSDEPLSCNDCPLRLQALQNTTSVSSHGNDRDAVLPMLAVLCGAVELPEIVTVRAPRLGEYVEHRCLCVVCTLCGLRAPPSSRV